LQGVSANYAELRSWSVLLGDFITLDDVESAGRVAVLGLDVVESLFGQRTFNPVGQIIRINDRPFTVVGVMTERGGTFVSEDNVVLIPISTAQTRLANARARDGGQIVSTIYVEVINEDLVPQATSEIENYLNEKHGIVFADEQDYTISSSADLLETINQLSGTLTIFSFSLPLSLC
jgi:putative ABC transport system permease protein